MCIDILPDVAVVEGALVAVDDSGLVAEVVAIDETVVDFSVAVVISAVWSRIKFLLLNVECN